MTRLALHHADLGYRKAETILAQVDFGVERGDYVLLAGANGSGKSTLIRSLLGSLPLLKGSREAAQDLRLGYVPQHLDIDPNFPVSVADVVAMGLWGPSRRVEGPDARGRVQEALGLVSMDHRRADLFGRLSGGQKQRVLLARALVMDPTLLLLDEPVSGVDAKATEIILEILRGQVAEGAAVVLVSHTPLALRDHASRAILVKAGKLEELPVPTLCSAEGLEMLWA